MSCLCRYSPCAHLAIYACSLGHAGPRQRSAAKRLLGISALLLVTLVLFATSGCSSGGGQSQSGQGYPPPVPSGLTASAGNGKIVLSWTSSIGATSYSIYRSSQSGGEGSTAYRSGLTANTFTDTGLTNGTAYFYTVASVNSSGISTQSTQTSATPEGSVNIISSVTTNASRYSPGAAAAISVTLSNLGSNSVSGTVNINITQLGALTQALTPQGFSLAASQSTTQTFTWTTPNKDFTGYLVQATASDNNNATLGSMNSAIDVSSNWIRFPRYGYMTSNIFGTSSPNSANIIGSMTQYHIDGIQYYDWQWKHHIPLSGTVASPSTSWIDDGSDATIYASSVKGLIAAGHANNIVAMAYNSIYSALNGTDGFSAYWQDGSGVSQSWGLYASSNGLSGAMLSFYQWQYMDPTNTQWQQYLLNREIQAIQAFGFDGFHADCFGDINEIGYTSTGVPAGVTNDTCATDTNGWDSTIFLNNNAGSPNFVNGTFPRFLQYAKSQLGSSYLIFNPVSFDHAHCEVDASPVDILYTELWPNADQFITYQTLKEAIDTARTESQAATGTAKSLVVAAYVDYNPSSGVGSGFNLPDVLLLDATLFASGGSHIEIGDGANMMNQVNWPTNSIPMASTPALPAEVLTYYNFLTAYENLLRDGQSDTTQIVSIAGQTVASSATPNSIWAFTKSDSTHEILHLINLSGENSTDWQTGACEGCIYTSPHPTPTAATNLTVKYYNINPIQSVSLASPDISGGTSATLAFTNGSDSSGSYITFTIPSLQYWDMVYMTNQ